MRITIDALKNQWENFIPVVSAPEQERLKTLQKNYDKLEKTPSLQESDFDKVAKKEKTKKKENLVGRYVWIKETNCSLTFSPISTNYFSDLHYLNNLVIGKQLKSTRQIFHNPPNVFKLYPYISKFKARKSAISHLGLIIYYSSKPYQGLLYEWFHGLNYARQQNKAEWFNHNFKFPNCLFPRIYNNNPTGHPRLTTLGITSSTMEKLNWKKRSLTLFAQRTRFFLWELDFSNCHMRIFNALEPKTATNQNFLNKINVTESSYWDKITQELLDFINDKDCTLVNRKVIRKVCKIGFLALLNGSKPNNTKIVFNVLKDNLDNAGLEMTYLTGLVVNFIENHKLTKAILSTTKKWRD